MKNFLRLAAIIGTLPVTLTNGTTADATQIMADLNKIVNDVNANAAPLVGTALTTSNNNFTTVQSGVNATAGANFPTAQQVQSAEFITLSSIGGTGNAITASAPLSLSAYTRGSIFTFVPSVSNGGATTININSISAQTIFKNGVSNLNSNDLPAGRVAMIRRFTAADAAGTGFQLLNPPIAFALSSDVRSGASTLLAISPNAMQVGAGFSGFFQSGFQTITSAGALTIAHGLGRIPVLCQIVLLCGTGEQNYSAGDLVILSPDTQDIGNSRGASIVPDATNLNIRFGSSAGVFGILNKTTGAGTVITNGNWTVSFKAWA